MENQFNLPFRPDSTLKQELIDIYLMKALEWLTLSLQQNDNNSIRSVINDNPWESAYCIIEILRVRDFLIKTSAYHLNYDRKIENSIDYLLTRIQGGDEELSLDGNPYDTGLTIQAFLYYLDTFPNSDSSKRIINNKILERTTQWTIKFLKEWLTDRTMGEVDDVAQCTLAILLINKFYNNKAENNLDLPTLLQSVMEEILNLGKIEREQKDWGSIYTNSYVLITFIQFIDQFPNSNITFGITETIRYGIISLEKKFTNNWDQPPDTSLALQLYISSIKSPLIKHDFLPEIVFQSFRWLCDSKQRYQNGSIQRSVHYTVLFVGAIIQALTCEELNYLLEKPIYLAYDSILDTIVIRDVLDRSTMARLRLDMQLMKERELHIIHERDQTKNKYYRLIMINIWIAAIILFILIGIISQSIKFQDTLIKSPYIDQWEILLALSAIIFPATFALANYFQKKMPLPISRRN